MFIVWLKCMGPPSLCPIEGHEDGRQIMKNKNNVYNAIYVLCIKCIYNTLIFPCKISLKVKTYYFERILLFLGLWKCVTLLRDKFWLPINGKANIEIKKIFWKYFSYNYANKISDKQFCEVNSLDFSFLMPSSGSQEYS